MAASRQGLPTRRPTQPREATTPVSSAARDPTGTPDRGERTAKLSIPHKSRARLRSAGLDSFAGRVPLQPQRVEKPRKRSSIKPIAFERPGPEPHNASEIVAIDDSRFLFCDNNIGDALLELRLAADGAMACPLIRRPLRGIEPGTVDDLEGMTHVRTGGGSFIVAMPSLSLKRRKGCHRKKSKRGKESPARDCLLRITFGKDDWLEAEVLSGFRGWIVENAPELGKSPRYLPDDGGLNVEGLGWNPAEGVLLLGVRTPVIEGKPFILRVRLKQVDGPWSLSNLEMLPPVLLAIKDGRGEQGIRTIGFDPPRGAWLIVAGNSTSASRAPFTLYSWDGNPRGVVHHFEDVRFHKRMKAEGVTHGTVGGRGAVVFVDDAGGYQVLWDDDPRLTR
jgi:Protein of unknown function (DUF3616)